MQAEPIQFGAVKGFRAKRSAAGFSQPIRSARKPAGDKTTAVVLDAAFADFVRVDAGTPSIAAGNKSVPPNWPSMTQALIADIATQLESLEGQRRQLARLLNSVDTNTTV
jgi:hypothetical protein